MVANLFACIQKEHHMCAVKKGKMLHRRIAMCMFVDFFLLSAVEFCIFLYVRNRGEIISVNITDHKN